MFGGGKMKEIVYRITVNEAVYNVTVVQKSKQDMKKIQKTKKLKEPKKSCTERLKGIATPVFYVSLIVICSLPIFFLIISVLKNLHILDGLVNTVENFVCFIKPLVPLFAAVFGASYIARGLTDKADKEIKKAGKEAVNTSVQKMGKHAPYYIGQENNRFYYIGQKNENFDFNKIADYKTEIGTDWDFTPQWKPAIQNLIKAKKIGVNADVLPDYSGNGERHCRGMFFVFSTSREIPKGQSANS
jgi:hypothetical protein